MNSAARGGGGGNLLSMLLGDYSMKAWMGRLVTTAEVYAPNGKMIAAFNSDGGWTEISTEAEYQFLSQADQIYSEAFKKARAEINAATKSPVAETGTSFDTRV